MIFIFYVTNLSNFFSQSKPKTQLILIYVDTKPGWFPVIKQLLLIWDFLVGCSHSRRGSSGLAVEPVCDLRASLCAQWAHKPGHCSSLHADQATTRQLLQGQGRSVCLCARKDN